MTARTLLLLSVLLGATVTILPGVSATCAGQNPSDGQGLVCYGWSGGQDTTCLTYSVDPPVPRTFQYGGACAPIDRIVLCSPSGQAWC